jgi:D-alanine-D-alanine ligase
MKIVVLAGGLSTERNVSLSSGTMVCEALRERGHQAVLVDAFLGLEDYEYPTSVLFDYPPDMGGTKVDTQAPDLEAVRASRKWQSPCLLGKGVMAACQMADLVFIALHGECGEDGRIQATFDLLGIPYTGSGYRGAAIAMDKGLTKELVQPHGIRTPKWKRYTYTREDIPAIVAEQKAPCVVKIPRGGSSIGVIIVREQEKLPQALEDALTMDDTVIIEEFVEGKECTCAVLEDRALPSVEIVPQVGFYDYKNKYQPGATVELCPARVSPEVEAEMGRMALEVHRLLGLRTYSRSDFIITEAGEVYFLEVNTLPGMTPTSLVPQEAAAVGISYGELCEIIIQDALKR